MSNMMDEGGTMDGTTEGLARRIEGIRRDFASLMLRSESLVRDISTRIKDRYCRGCGVPLIHHGKGRPAEWCDECREAGIPKLYAKRRERIIGKEAAGGHAGTPVE